MKAWRAEAIAARRLSRKRTFGGIAEPLRRNCPALGTIPQAKFSNLLLEDGETGKIALNKRRLSGTQINHSNVLVWAFPSGPRL